MSVKTPLETIIDFNAVGKEENPIKPNEILKIAYKENVPESSEDKKKNLMMFVDYQKDFLEGGSLGVPGSLDDVKNAIKFYWNNFEKLTCTYMSMDMHIPQMIFHACWWVDEKGNFPEEMTVITSEDVDNGKWKPLYREEDSKRYVKKLEEQGSKKLVIWPYHCLKGTIGNSLENQLMNLVYFHSAVRKYSPKIIEKGEDPITEMYGVFKPEYDEYGIANTDLLEKMAAFNNIYIAGEAKSHCVMETLKQFFKHYKDKPEITSKVHIIEDTMGVIPGFEEETKEAFKEFTDKYKAKIIKSDHKIKG